MRDSKVSPNKSQQNNRKQAKKSYFLAHSVYKNHLSYFQTLTPLQHQIFNALIWHCNKFGEVRPSQTTIAYYAKVSREYVNRVFKEFEELGIIHSFYRHMKTSLYTLNRFFYIPSVRQSLKHLISNFRYFTLYTLPMLSEHQLFTQNNIYIYKPVSTIIQSSTKDKYFYNWSGKKEDMMNPISDRIRGITVIKLTKWGQIKLSAFPDEIIDAVEYRLKHTRNVTNPFGFFLAGCLKECKQKGIQPNWKKVDFFMATYKMPENARMTFDLPQQDSTKILSSAERFAQTRTLSSPPRTEHKTREEEADNLRRGYAALSSEERERLERLGLLFNPWEVKDERGSITTKERTFNDTLSYRDGNFVPVGRIIANFPIKEDSA